MGCGPEVSVRKEHGLLKNWREEKSRGSEEQEKRRN
jgi:hypothetical protein